MKKSSNLLIKYTFLLCTIIFFSLNSCSKEDEVTNAEPISLSTEKKQYAPFEIVTIKTVENIFSVATQIGKINGVDVELATDGNNAAFVLPNFANGTYNLTFSLGNNRYNVPVKVAALTSISSTDTYFSEMQSNLNDNISDLNNHISNLQIAEGNKAEVQTLQNDLVFYQNQLNSYTSQYNRLTSEEKIIFAETIAANKATIDEYNMLTADFNQSIASLSTTQTVQDYETQVEISKGKFAARVIYTVGHIPFILAGGKVAAASSGNPGVLLALGVVVTSFMVNVMNTATMAKTLTSKSLKPDEFIIESGQKVFQTGVETVENAQAKYRSLINSDGGNATISNIVDTYNNLKDKYNNFRNNLPSIFRPSFVIASLKNTFTSTTRSVYNQYINITNVSNPNVSLQKIAQSDGSLKLKATTSATTDQTFTYDVEYTNSNFASNLKKSVNAKVLVVTDSTAIYKAACVGWWTVKGYDPINPTTTYTLELFADGSGTYHLSGDPVTYRTRWNIQKSGNEYRLYESGFWHPAYNNLTRGKLTYPLTMFRTYANFDPKFISQEYIKN